MNIMFERAVAEDVEALVEVQIRAFHDDARIYPGVELGGPPGYDSFVATLKKIEGDEFYKILYDNQIIGGIVIFVYGDGHYHLDLLYIDPDYHNHGIGTQAMQFIEQVYPASKWTLDTPLYATRNQHFYEKFGYIKVREYLEPGSDGITLIAYEKQS